MQSGLSQKHLTLHGILLGSQLLALWFMLGPSLANPGFPLDDAWIHQVIARTFAETGTLGYEPQRFGSAATSLLWPAVLALNPAFFDWSPVFFTVLVGVIAFVVAGQLVLRMLLADGFSASSALLGAVLFSAAGNGVWFAASGMESILIVVFSCAAVHWSFRVALGWSLATGFALGLLFLTRPECAMLSPLVIGAVLLRGERGTKRILALSLPVLGSILLFLSLNFINTGSLKPSTLSGRKWMWLAPGEGWSALEHVRVYLLIWTERLNLYTLGFEHPIVFWIALGFAVVGAFEVIRFRAHQISLLTFWALVHLTTYAVLLPTPGHGGRYQPLTPFIFMMLVGFGVVSVGRSLSSLAVARWPDAQLPPLLARYVTVLLGAPIALQALLVDQTWGHAHAMAVKHVNDTEVAMGHSLNRLPPNAKVASFDIGGIGYFSQRPVLDLGGLVDPAIVPRLKQGNTAELLLERGVEYVVLPLAYSNTFPDPWNFAERLGFLHQGWIELNPIVEHVSEPEVWTPGIEATWHCSPRQVLFRVEAIHGE